MLSIIAITYLGQDLFEIWQRKQGREDSLETSKWKYEKKQAITLYLVDFETLEIYSLQGWHVGCSIRDYWVDMEYDEEKLEVNAYCLPTRE